MNNKSSKITLFVIVFDRKKQRSIYLYGLLLYVFKV